MGSEPSSERDCPECGGETVWDDQAKERVCLECGFVVEGIENNEEKSETEVSGDEWTALESQREDQQNDREQASAPETSAEWEMWYPCPVCHSTELSQIVESHLSVSATKDGSYGGESSVEEYNYVECSNCGEVLLDELGKSRYFPNESREYCLNAMKQSLSV